MWQLSVTFTSCSAVMKNAWEHNPHSFYRNSQVIFSVIFHYSLLYYTDFEKFWEREVFTWQCSAGIHIARPCFKPVISPTGWISEMAIWNNVVRKDSFFSFLFYLLFLILSCQFEILAFSISVLSILAYSIYPCYYDLYFLNQRGKKNLILVTASHAAKNAHFYAQWCF